MESQVAQQFCVHGVKVLYDFFYHTFSEKENLEEEERTDVVNLNFNPSVNSVDRHDFDEDAGRGRSAKEPLSEPLTTKNSVKHSRGHVALDF